MCRVIAVSNQKGGVHIFISSDTEEDVEIIKNTFERWRESQ